VSKLKPFRGFLELTFFNKVLRDDVVVDMQLEMPPCRLAVDKSVRFNSCFLRLSLALDRDAPAEAPLRRPSVRAGAAWVLVENVLEYLLERIVGRKLVHDLAENRLRKRLGGRENRDGYLGIAQDLLNGTTYTDNAGLAVRARPQINVAVGIGLDLAAPVKEPLVIEIIASERPRQQIESIIAGKQRLVIILQAPLLYLVIELAGRRMVIIR